MAINNTKPILPLRDIVVFPGMIVPLFVGRDKSIRALNEETFSTIAFEAKFFSFKDDKIGFAWLIFLI